MSKFYSVKVGDKLKFIGCSCGYGLYLEDVVECIGIKLDKFFWINPHTGERRMTQMGSPCFELVANVVKVKQEVAQEQIAPMSVDVVEETEVAKETEVKTKKVKSSPSRKKKSK